MRYSSVLLPRSFDALSCFFAAWLGLFFSASGMCAVIGVPGDYTFIQEAIDAAQLGDTILVSPGTYVENVDLRGKGLTLKSSHGASATVIDGSQCSAAVKFSTPIGPESVLDGFTVTHGGGFFSSGELRGGGIYMEGHMSPVIENCIITGNAASKGGGIYCNYSEPIITCNVITENTATEGCGIYCDYASNPRIENNHIYDNHEGVWASSGGGIFCGDLSMPQISGNVIEGHDTYQGGAIACFDDSAPYIVNNIFCFNNAERGGALYSSYNARPLVVNCTFYKNTSSFHGGGICIQGATEVTVLNSILWMDTGNEIYIFTGGTNPTVEYSCVQGGWPGAGNIHQDPRFVDPDAGDLHLRFTSPCRNNGSSEVSSMPAADFEGDPRPAFGKVDIGADEFYTHLYHVGECAAGATIEIKIIGLPTTSPVGLWLSTGLLDPPIPSVWGDWYLELPALGPFILGAVPAPEGVIVLSAEVPNLPEPIEIFMQAMVGSGFTQCHKIEIE
ncbi:MAG: right-handed parallel beta-helix repeat-containing protein [Planctomycetota bacterium]